MFSVVIPLYNKEKYIGRAINSVLNQTYQKFELIVVDDGSEDDGANIVKGFQNKDDRIKLIQQSNAGVSSARNKGISQASYDYIAFLDADDEWLDNFLFSIEGLIKSYPEAKAFGTAYKIVKNNRLIIPKFKYCPTNSSGGIINSYFKTALSKTNPLTSSSICIERNVLILLEGFPENEKYGEDLTMWAKIAFFNKIAWTHTIGAIRHYDAENRISTNYNRKNKYALLDIAEKAIKNRQVMHQELNYLKKYLEHQKLAVAGKLILAGNAEDAKYYTKLVKKRYLIKKIIIKLILRMRNPRKYYQFIQMLKKII